MTLSLRKASYSDADLLLNWANDSLVRQNSVTTEQIDRDTHSSWLASCLANASDCLLFVVEKDATPVGQLRLDRGEFGWKINYSIATEFRGRSFGAKVLILAKEIVKQRHDGMVLFGYAKEENVASIKAFLKADFVETHRTDGLIYFTS